MKNKTYPVTNQINGPVAGHIENIRVEGDYLVGDIVVTDRSLIEQIGFQKKRTKLQKLKGEKK